ncbi:hypothetical protein NL676_006997 [Syzygium grande]|nr:hypothetical protein NL676_006997 [Syzygium grande]
MALSRGMGSGKVLYSSPNTHIFFYYMPVGDNTYANDLMNVLRQMYEAKKYRNMDMHRGVRVGGMLQGCSLKI